jgi:NAD(P)-dependent dehydrogenase (short-subunit alcohol dehydrogenase family)
MPVWLITGCSSGIGREIATVALEQGCRVAVTARDPASVSELAARHRGRALTPALDVTRAEQVRGAVAATLDAFGRIDVLVNNAAYGYLAAIEEGEEAEVRALFDTNYFGAVAMIKAVLPAMRARRAGHIINISSTTGFVANPGVGYYSASKFALESLSEGLGKEVAPFGIKVTLAALGSYITDWARRSAHETRTPIADYDATVGARRRMIRTVPDPNAGDPRRCAEQIFRIALSPSAPPRLLLGADVLAAYRAKLAELAALLTEWESVSRLPSERAR